MSKYKKNITKKIALGALCLAALAGCGPLNKGGKLEKFNPLDKDPASNVSNWSKYDSSHNFYVGGNGDKKDSYFADPKNDDYTIAFDRKNWTKISGSELEKILENNPELKNRSVYRINATVPCKNKEGKQNVLVAYVSGNPNFHFYIENDKEDPYKLRMYAVENIQSKDAIDFGHGASGGSGGAAGGGGSSGGASGGSGGSGGSGAGAAGGSGAGGSGGGAR